jgi:hypothetical protein
VRDREERIRVRGEDRFLLVRVGGADRQDRPLRGCFMAKALNVSLAERALPGEGLAANLPRTVDLPVFVDALGDLGEGQCDPGNVVERLHDRPPTPRRRR